MEYYDYKDKAIEEFVKDSEFIEVLNMFESEFKYGIVNIRDDGIVEISPRGWSDDEDLLYIANSCYNFASHRIGQLYATHYYVLNNEDRFDKDYEIMEVQAEVEVIPFIVVQELFDLKRSELEDLMVKKYNRYRKTMMTRWKNE